MWDRRAFLKSAGIAFTASLLPRAAEAVEKSDIIFASAGTTSDGRFAAALVTERAELVQMVDLPGRGHDVTQCPATGRLAVFARRPGNFAIVFDPHTGKTATITSPVNRHFYGHGQFTADGHLLLATENDFETTQGKIGIYDASDGFRRIGEWDTGGIGPHEMIFNAEESLLCVANGGIETHPDFGRAKLNIDSMQPSLVWLDMRSGAMVTQQFLTPDMHKLSLRHLALGRNGRVWFGAQDQTEAPSKDDVPPLVGFAGPDEALGFVDLPEASLRALQGYVGSVAFNDESYQVAVTSPRGNVALLLDEAGQVAATRQMHDVCGLAPLGSGFEASTGEGRLFGFDGHGANDQGARAEFSFDNHMLRLG